MTSTDNIGIASFGRGTGMDLLRCQRGLASWLAPQLGILPHAISMWKVIPAERCRDIEAATGIPLHLLRPDLWPPPWASEPLRSIRRNNMGKAKKPQEVIA